MTDVFDLEDNEPISQRDARTGVAEQRPPRSVRKYAGLFYFTKVLIIPKLQTAHQINVLLSHGLQFLFLDSCFGVCKYLSNFVFMPSKEKLK